MWGTLRCFEQDYGDELARFFGPGARLTDALDIFGRNRSSTGICCRSRSCVSLTLQSRWQDLSLEESLGVGPWTPGSGSWTPGSG